MQIKTNIVEISINIGNEESAVIHLNPNDRGFLRDLLQLNERVSGKMKSVDLTKYKESLNDGIKIDVDVTKIENIEQLSEERLKSVQNKLLTMISIDEEYQNVVKTELNSIFKQDVSSKLFKYFQPLDDVVVDKNGKEITMPFITYCLEKIAEDFQKYDKNRREKMDKHLNKYRKNDKV